MVMQEKEKDSVTLDSTPQQTVNTVTSDLTMQTMQQQMELQSQMEADMRQEAASREEAIRQ